MSIVVGIVLVVLVLYVANREYMQRDAAARAEGLAPLTHAQRKAARKAEREGRPYKPQRRAYGTPPPFKPGRKRFD